MPNCGHFAIYDMFTRAGDDHPLPIEPIVDFLMENEKSQPTRVIEVDTWHAPNALKMRQLLASLQQVRDQPFVFMGIDLKN